MARNSRVVVDDLAFGKPLLWVHDFIKIGEANVSPRHPKYGLVCHYRDRTFEGLLQLLLRFLTVPKVARRVSTSSLSGLIRL